MRIVKLGGSLYQTAELTLWVQQLARLSSDSPIIIVPGGGPFADQVRHAQQQHPVSDATAHHMALLAMTQFGLLISSLAPDCGHFIYPSSTPRAHQGLSVWLPDRALLEVSEIPQNWDITSDSLSLWLAQQLDADELSIVKHLTPDNLKIDNLVKTGVLDQGFSAFYQQHAIATRLVHYQHYADFPHTGSLLI